MTDLGPIADLVPVPAAEAACLVDAREKARGFPCKYRFCSKRVVCRYHDRAPACVKREDIVACVRAIEEFLDRIPRDFGLSMPALQTAGKRYALYISGTGLDPEPADLTNGVVGAANEHMMVLHPDAVRELASDAAERLVTIVHELGHGFFWVPWKRIWLEESLNEYLAWYYTPCYGAFWDRAVSAVFRRPWVNPLSASNSEDRRYDVGAFWAWVAATHGGPRAVGAAANAAFRPPPPPPKPPAGKRPPAAPVPAAPAPGPEPHMFELLAAHLAVPARELAVGWALACLSPTFFWSASATSDPEAARRAAVQRLAGRGGFRCAANKALIWDAKTFEWPAVPMQRLEPYGFEVSAPLPAAAAAGPELDPAKYVVKFVVTQAADGVPTAHDAAPAGAAAGTVRALVVRVAP